MPTMQCWLILGAAVIFCVAVADGNVCKFVVKCNGSNLIVLNTGNAFYSFFCKHKWEQLISLF